MKKVFVLAFIAIIVSVFYSCPGTPAVNPGRGPNISFQMPEEISPDPADPLIGIPITVDHRDSNGVNIPIADWRIEVRTARQLRLIAQREEQDRERQEREARGEEVEPARQRRPLLPFYELSGEGAIPSVWEWNGRSTDGNDSMTSLTEYQVAITATDMFGNTSTVTEDFESGVIVRLDGDVLKIDVDSIIFQADQANFLNVAGNVTERDVRNNQRIMRLVGRALERYDGYRVTVEGHANAVSVPGTNPTRDNQLRTLSEARARAIVDNLVAEHNIARARLSAVGRGVEQMVADWQDNEENFRNRRVEFILVRE